MLKAGLQWDPSARKWHAVDYSSLTTQELELRRKDAENTAAETEAQLKGLLPVAASQAILNQSMIGLQAMLIKLAKEAPEALLKII